ncbi:hypothetical protein FGIG_06395 [Fasciola gigantica]|uniref:UV radiation resistance-associated gene protein n=1 Tax=Fasciola gigantica TaxID=46835 RepID=A0A504YC70_FASGI|nr:hypothetical protein FGIG_06395 [Fasciola gigantica]
MSSRFRFKDAEREQKQTEILVLQSRLNVLRASIQESREKLRSIAEQRSQTETDLNLVVRATKTINEQCETVALLLQKHRLRLTAVRKALSFRTRQLVREVTELFTAELARLIPSCAVDFSIPIGETAESCSQKEQITSQNTDSVVNDRFFKLWENHQALITQDSDTDLAAVSLGLVAHLLCLISTILNQPIRYPFDLSEGYSRSAVIDQITPEFSDTGRVFPLYLLRSSLVPAYRHAIALLHRNLVALRSLMGLSTPRERTTMGNLGNLLQYCLSSD